MLFSICFNGISGQIQISESKLKDDVIVIFATNNDDFPYTVSLDLITTNMKKDKDVNDKILIPGGEKNFEIVRLKGLNGPYTYKYNYTYEKGNTFTSRHDDNFIYFLPCDEKFKIIQGYFGSFSHKGKRALDFKMPVGSKVYAARGGTIIEIRESSSTGCKSSKCMKEGNYILILHDDGSYASYFHLQKDGAIVNQGEEVKQGEHIAYSGNTGWSSEPHLHFEVYTNNNGVRNTVATKFKTSKGIKSF